MTYPREEEAVVAGAIMLLHRLGGSATFTDAEWAEVIAKFGRRPVVVVEDVDYRTMRPRRLMVLDRDEALRVSDEREHKRSGHVRCECGNWIARAPGGWYHVDQLGDEIALHFASPV